MTIYSVGIVGESYYQKAIRRCRVGDAVGIIHEIGNPYSADALVVVSAEGYTLGYVAEESWLQTAIHDEGKSCAAKIKCIESGNKGLLGVVLDVQTLRGPIPTIAYSPAPQNPPEPRGWLARLLFGP